MAEAEHGRYAIAFAPRRARKVACGQNGVTFKWKDYRIEGPARYKSMTLPTHEFIRRFLMHVLPKGLHRIRPQASPQGLPEAFLDKW
jgi:hypothetical protein